MFTIKGRNVNDIYLEARRILYEDGISQDSRVGRVLAMPGPVLTCYERPLERVLFDPRRDANPFFHIFEGIWMLAGQDDARMLDHFIKDFSSRFAEQDGRVHGAYGRRWRYHFGTEREIETGLGMYPEWTAIDQLKTVIKLLRENPLDRQAVIQMWDAEVDLGVPGLNDRPCNTQIYLRIVDGALDLTTTSRSHDAIFGATGANAVHFSMLQEYLAAGIGVPIGKMYQFSNNYHAYEDIFTKTSHGDVNYINSTNYYREDVLDKAVSPYPMVSDFGAFDRDVSVFLEGDWVRDHKVFSNPWFSEVLTPVVRGGLQWRAGQRDAALDSVSECRASDWRLACQQWMERRMNGRTK